VDRLLSKKQNSFGKNLGNLHSGDTFGQKHSKNFNSNYGYGNDGYNYQGG